jgi:DNA repair protein RadC
MYKLHELPERERPRHRIAEHGGPALSDSELLAIVLHSGVAGANAIDLAQKLLIELGGLHGLLRADATRLCEIHGIGPAKAAQIMASLELSRRLLFYAEGERFQVKTPTDVAHMLMREYGHHDQETLSTLLLDTKNRVIRLVEVYRGSLNTSLVRVGEVFKEALKANAAALILCHNHPSGDPTPSPEDILVTRQIIQASSILDIEVLDHIIVGEGRFVSMRERGLGFTK